MSRGAFRAMWLCFLLASAAVALGTCELLDERGGPLNNGDMATVPPHASELVPPVTAPERHPSPAPGRGAATSTAQDTAEAVDPDMARIIDSLRSQISTIDTNLERNSSTGPSSSEPLGHDLEVADKLWTRARLAVAVDLIERGDYTLVAEGKTPPPERPGHDRLRHGRVRVDGQHYDIVVFVPWDHPSVAGKLQYYQATFRAYWEKFTADFNEQPVAKRRFLIERHMQARSGSTTERRPDSMTAEEREAAIIRGPITVDAEHWLLRFNH